MYGYYIDARSEKYDHGAKIIGFTQTLTKFKSSTPSYWVSSFPPFSFHLLLFFTLSLDQPSNVNVTAERSSGPLRSQTTQSGRRTKAAKPKHKVTNSATFPNLHQSCFYLRLFLESFLEGSFAF